MQMQRMCLMLRRAVMASWASLISITEEQRRLHCGSHVCLENTIVPRCWMLLKPPGKSLVLQAARKTTSSLF